MWVNLILRCLFRFLVLLRHFLEFCFEFAEFFEFKIHSAPWTTVGSQIFFADTKDLKLG
jgi:hypothetical protein